MDLLQPIDDARAAGLVHVSDDQPGYMRVRWGRGFRYRLPSGLWLRDERELLRIRALVIPPAWREGWICRDPRGHLQVTGLDDRGRKQYRYHPEWTEHRNVAKFDQMAAFGRALLPIRRRVGADLKGRGMSRRRVLAAVVRLLDRTLVRVGNDEYARENDSYGLTTLRQNQASVNGSTIRLRFTGKSGRSCDLRVDDRRVATVVRNCQELPNQELFQWVDAEGAARDVTSGHVNEYLLETSVGPFTAKDFRTWGGTVAAAEAFDAAGHPNGQEIDDRQRKKREVAAVRCASELLRNTMATCRQFYVHPSLQEWWADGTLEKAFERARAHRVPRGLTVAERAVLWCLER